MSDAERLQEKARLVQKLLRDQARRPYVLEVTGTPKAGKTSAIGLIESFFKTCDWSVHVLRERAAACPLPMKGHFFFNTWTTATMLAEVLEVIESSADLVILDRGFFDALVWLELQRSRKQVSAEDAKTFRDFVVLDRWRQLVDATFVMKVDPATAVERENFGRLVPRRGSMMNAASLAEFNDALEATSRDEADQFDLASFDCAARGSKEVALDLAAATLERVKAWADPAIAVVPRQVVERLLRDRAIAWPAAESVWQEIASHVSMQVRSTAEADPDLVHIVAGGVQAFEDGIFVWDRSKDQRRRRDHGRYALWRGCHIEHGDGDGDLMEDVVDSLVARLRSDVHFHFELEPKPLGLIWDPEKYRNGKHLGLIFRVALTDPVVAHSLEEKEFKTGGRGHPATSRFTSIETLSSIQDLEAWSNLILSKGWLTA